MSSISRFSSQRGRPKMAPRDVDYGTPELVFKRAHGETIEALDGCLDRGVIGRAHHASGIHLRWLYTLRYGAPGVSALDLLRGAGAAADGAGDEAWRAEREAEYEEAARVLMQRKCYAAVVAVCVHDVRPRSLQQLSQLREGLEELAVLWRKGKAIGNRD